MGVKTADRTLDLLELFAREKKALSLTEIAARLETPMSSTHALIKTLEDRGYVFEFSRRKGYYPTGKLRAVANAVSNGSTLLKTLEPLLQDLCEETQETVVVAVRHDDVSGMYVDACISLQSVRFSPTLGQTKPLHSTATGKALLGALPVPERQALVARLPMEELTTRTITDRQQLLADLDAGNERGWHDVVGENVLDLMSIARTVTIDGVDYAIGLAGPIQRFLPQTEVQAGRLLAACRQIEALTRT